MKLSPRRIAATLAVPVALAWLLLASSGASGSMPPRGTAAVQQRDTTVVMETGDRIYVTVRPLLRPGTELCAALGTGVRGGKTLVAGNDAHTPGIGLPTQVRFPGAGTTPRCEVHRQTAGDTLWVEFSKQVRHRTYGLGRLRVGYVALPVARLARQRVTFRWMAEGADSLPPQPDVEGPGR